MTDCNSFNKYETLVESRLYFYFINLLLIFLYILSALATLYVPVVIVTLAK